MQAAAIQTTVATVAGVTSGLLLVFDTENVTGLLPTFLNFAAGPLLRSANRIWSATEITSNLREYIGHHLFGDRGLRDVEQMGRRIWGP